MAVAVAALAAAFCVPLGDLVRFSYASTLYSYILLIAPISAWLIWLRRDEWRSATPTGRRWAPLPALAGVAILVGYFLARRKGWEPAEEDYLAVMTTAFLLLLAASAWWILGGATLRKYAFPVTFLVFMIPITPGIRDSLESGLQQGSAAVAAVFFAVFRTPVLQDGLFFHLPAITIQVAPECSGIHSTVVLFITSILAAHLFLRATWRRILLVLCVIPLAFLRNGFRIYVIGQLCASIGPEMINSYIHRHGGPLFFALSLVPLFWLLHVLRRAEARKPAPPRSPKTGAGAARVLGLILTAIVVTHAARAQSVAPGPTMSTELRVDSSSYDKPASSPATAQSSSYYDGKEYAGENVGLGSAPSVSATAAVADAYFTSNPSATPQLAAATTDLVFSFIVSDGGTDTMPVPVTISGKLGVSVSSQGQSSFLSGVPGTGAEAKIYWGAGSGLTTSSGTLLASAPATDNGSVTGQVDQTITVSANTVYSILLHAAAGAFPEVSANGTLKGGISYANGYVDPVVAIATAFSTAHPNFEIGFFPGAGTSANSNAPVVTSNPGSVSVQPGSTAVFAVGATGSGLSYQWYVNGTAIPGATDSTYVTTGVTSANVGSYTCVVTGTNGSTTSGGAVLALSTQDPGRLINLSCRAQAAPGAGQLVAGFVVDGAGGSGTLPLLIRASGPALNAYGVSGTLGDPKLDLFAPMTSAAVPIATNTGWNGSAAISSEAATLGAFAWTDPTSKDSALWQSLAAGQYTANVSGASGDSGVALVELYDGTATAPYAAGAPLLVNISARAEVMAGSGQLIAGFVIGGKTYETVLIRAAGPALIPLGVSGVLSDPKLELHSTGSGDQVIESDVGWGGSSEIAAAATRVGAFSWGASPTADSALLVTLPPGQYTANVSGASGDSGIALIEVYRVP